MHGPWPVFPLRVVIWGVGLMGGSLALALKAAGAASAVVGVGRNPEALADAAARGLLDHCTTDPAAALTGSAGVLVLGAPVSVIVAQAAEWGPRIPPGWVVTDLGSTKGEVVAAWEAHLGAGAAFVGSHPMCGSEKASYRHARADLYHRAPWVLTPTEHTPPAAVGLIWQLAEAAGSRVITMRPELHDRRVAYVSHVPQVAATAVAAAALAGEEEHEGVLDLAGSGFRDTTRIAGSPTAIWQDILLTNRAAVLEGLAALRQALDGLEAAVRSGDAEGIARWFERGHQARQRLTER